LRIALGARGRDLISLVLSQGLRLAAIGVALGLILSLTLATLIANLLYGIDARDPVTFGGATPVALLVAIIACLVPAVRATEVDPIISLRAE